VTPEDLRPEERRLVEALRAIPPSALRDRFSLLLSELADFVAAPGCAESQADGAPCNSVQASCDECRKVTDLLEGLRTRLHAG
jgi:hypothetical protein